MNTQSQPQVQNKDSIMWSRKMKNLLTISLLIFSLNAANFTNNGATITIGEGVTLRADGDFENNGTLINNGTFATSGQFSGENSLSGTNVTYYGDAQVMEMSYNDLTIQGANSLSNSVQSNNLIISGDLNLSGHSVHVLNSFIREGGDISGEGFLQATPVIESPALDNIYGLGFIVSHLGTSDINIKRYAGMVDNNNRASLNTYFHIDLVLEDAFSDIPSTIGIALEDQDLIGLNTIPVTDFDISFTFDECVALELFGAVDTSCTLILIVKKNVLY